MIENRPRRLRKTAAIRRLVAETQLSVDDLVAPLFIREGINTPEPVHSLPGVFQHTRKSLLEEVKKLRDRGIPGLVLFGIGMLFTFPIAMAAWASCYLKNAATISLNIRHLLARG